MTKMERLERAFNEAKEILDNLGISYSKCIFGPCINTRAKSRWGRCSYNRRTGLFSIEINADLLDDGVSHEALMNTVIHELLHADEKRFSDGHRGAWKMCANLVNTYYPQYNIKCATSPEEKGIADSISNRSYGVKYIVTCESCGYVNRYKRKSKVVTLIERKPCGACRCGVCGGSKFSLKYC